MQLSKSLVGTNAKLFFHNYFATPSLMLKLKLNKIYSCCTVCENRKGMAKIFKKDKEINRGDIYRRQSEPINLVKWMDTKGVIVLFAIDFFLPTVSVQQDYTTKGLVTEQLSTKELVQSNYSLGQKFKTTFGKRHILEKSFLIT